MTDEFVDIDLNKLKKVIINAFVLKAFDPEAYVKKLDKALIKAEAQKRAESIEGYFGKEPEEQNKLLKEEIEKASKENTYKTQKDDADSWKKENILASIKNAKVWKKKIINKTATDDETTNYANFCEKMKELLTEADCLALLKGETKQYGDKAKVQNNIAKSIFSASTRLLTLDSPVLVLLLLPISLTALVAGSAAALVTLALSSKSKIQSNKKKKAATKLAAAKGNGSLSEKDDKKLGEKYADSIFEKLTKKIKTKTEIEKTETEIVNQTKIEEVKEKLDNELNKNKEKQIELNKLKKESEDIEKRLRPKNRILKYIYEKLKINTNTTQLEDKLGLLQEKIDDLRR